jgi:VWFA-related protein
VIARVRWVIVLGYAGLMGCGYCAAQQNTETQSTVPQVEVNVNRVLVPVVVRDKQGRVVGDLKERDFTVLDNDKPRVISGFLTERHATPGNAGNGEPASNAPHAGAGAVPGAPVAGLPDRITVFLFDDLHMSAAETARAKAAASEVLADVVTGTDVAAVVSLSGAVNSGLTRNREKLQAELMSVVPHKLFQTDATQCGNIDYYQANLIVNMGDAEAMRDALKGEALCNPAMQIGEGDMPVAQNLVESAARRALALGHQDMQESFAVIDEIVGRMAKLPGQRTLVLASSGFLDVEPYALAAESKVLNDAAQSNVIVSSIDARGLFVSELSASERGPGAGGPNPDFRRAEMVAAENPMAVLADGTGGIFFHDSNDLAAGFRQVTEAPAVVYLLELSLDGVKADGAYHKLKVRVDREGVEVQARRGYFMPRSEKKK